ncbi:DNA mismatch repair protein MutS [Salipaludibacillus sp. LMS25]|jgi:DNA mismatch repair protein MutS|uniref:DNA mismatch repair protein MutS n=1 Tax=Salipaludibacillus sp. LMS25 TaxID=2924031 RepID=UPI0020D1C034|nr:DNA mismatch repair protein MutS [Salipaludibacillus sp. LMS25]UTR15020.1 DNA mismatch repair protein MutS [Salipaludibacillus sp. LMS25]
MAATTPMMEQYLRIKADYEDAFLFFRLGDFYEMFYDDAKKAAKELEITLTARGKGEDRIPMCGVPYHSAEHYIAQLIEKGYKVAICEQTEDPAMAKGVVKREVVQIITPGTVMEGQAIHDNENNYLLSVTPFEGEEIGLAAVDMTTGEFKVTLLNDFEELLNEMTGYRPKEVIIPSSLAMEKQQTFEVRLKVTLSFEDHTEPVDEAVPLVDTLSEGKIKETCYQLIRYLQRTTKRSLEHLQQAVYYLPQEYMSMDAHSKRNLELVETLIDKKKQGSLLWVLDQTETAMGGRMLKQWIERPLLNKRMIENRHELVDKLIEHFFERESLQEQLQGIYDLERLSGRVAFGNVNGRDLIQLKKSLEKIPEIFKTLRELNSSYANSLMQNISDCSELRDLLETSIEENCPVSITEGGVIKDHYSDQLDDYRNAMRNGKAWIAALEKQEKELTGIKSLKVGFNKVFGYYIEVTKPNLPQLPEGRYERKQTLTNAERFITEDLKEKEALILEAEEKSGKLEYELFMAIREQVKAFIRPLQQLANVISIFDVLQSFAEVAEKHRYVKPELKLAGNVDIREGRHPVVEKMIDEGDYVANDIVLGDDRELLLITGPNMAGKSTYMRQLALISVMAQTGCYVPATYAELPIFDQIFTRIGAADDLAHGQSTFMVEMLETKHAVSKSTRNSLILLDEIGRGTSTYDGMSLAQAIIEYIHDEIGAKTLFSTHYHELTHLENDLPKLKNVHVSAKEENGTVVFLHKVVDGAADRSYGIYVAELAELPDKLISRAKVILAEFEKEQLDLQAHRVKASEENKESRTSFFQTEATNQPTQLSLFPTDSEKPSAKKDTLTKTQKKVLDDLETVNLLHISPIEAIQLLDKLQRKLSH